MDNRHVIIQLWVIGMILAAIFLAAFIWLFVFQRRRQNEHFIENAKLMFELERKEITVKIAEREIMMTQISKEVHDNIGQIANMVRMHFHEIDKLATNPHQIKYIKAAITFTDDLIKSAHNISYSLNSDYIKQRGLFGIISDQLEQIKFSSNIDRELEITDDKSPIAPEQALIIYRIAQEALNNIIRHSEATMIRVSIIHQGKFFKMVICDNGVGFCERAYEKGSIGINNMRERAKLLLGNLNIYSEPNKGCTVALFVNDITIANTL